MILWTLVVDGLRLICGADEMRSLSAYVIVLQEPRIPRHETVWLPALCVMREEVQQPRSRPQRLGRLIHMNNDRSMS